MKTSSESYATLQICLLPVNHLCMVSVGQFASCGVPVFQPSFPGQPQHSAATAVRSPLHVRQCGQSPLPHRSELAQCLLWSLTPWESLLTGRSGQDGVKSLSSLLPFLFFVTVFFFFFSSSSFLLLLLLLLFFLLFLHLLLLHLHLLLSLFPLLLLALKTRIEADFSASFRGLCGEKKPSTKPPNKLKTKLTSRTVDTNWQRVLAIPLHRLVSKSFQSLVVFGRENDC